jgi:hypothetical protein
MPEFAPSELDDAESPPESLEPVGVVSVTFDPSAQLMVVVLEPSAFDVLSTLALCMPDCKTNARRTTSAVRMRNDGLSPWPRRA